MTLSTEKIAVIVLGYVGLPVVIAFASAFGTVVGFVVSACRVVALQNHDDWTGEIVKRALVKTSLVITENPSEISSAAFLL